MDLMKIDNDMTEKEKKSLIDFISKGKPGFMGVVESDTFSWFTLYMSGKTYGEIAEITSRKKDLILFMSYKCGWYDKRISHYQDLAENMLEKLKRTKLDSVDTLTNGISALGKYCNSEFNKFMSTNDRSVIENFDFKVFAEYRKSIESLEKLINESSKTNAKKPTVNINMHGGTVEQIDEDTIEINDDNASDLLKALASFQDNKK